MKKNTKVFISGHFNVIHPGHLRLFKLARNYGDKVIVGVECDRIARKSSYVSETERYENLKKINIIDEVILINKSVEKTISEIKPNYILKGKEFETKNNPELKVMKKINAKLVFGSGESFLSLDNLLLNNHDEYKNWHISKSFNERHNLDSKLIINTINNFKNKNICIIGDVIVDEYIDCKPLGMSQEEPLVVSKPISTIKFLGGAAITASHGVGLGSKTNLISVIGNDDNGKFIKQKLDENGTNSYLIVDDTRTTTEKKRYRLNNQNAFRLNNFSEEKISKKIQDKIVEKFNKLSKKIDILIFSDFNYGCLPQELVNRLIVTAKKNNIYIAADSQSSSQYGNINRYKKVDLITPTEHEARTALNDNQSGLVVVIQKLQKESKAKDVFLKLGSDGLLIFSAKLKEKSKHTDILNSINKNAKDTNGAGDTLLVSSALAMKSSNNVWISALIGSVAAALQVNKVGNIPIKHEEIISIIKNFNN